MGKRTHQFTRQALYDLVHGELILKLLREADRSLGSEFANGRCAPWRAKRGRVVRGSHEAILTTRRALARQRGGKDRIRSWRPAIEGVLRSLRRACDGVAKRHGR